MMSQFDRDVVTSRDWQFEKTVKLKTGHLVVRAFMVALGLFSMHVNADANVDMPLISKDGIDYAWDELEGREQVITAALSVESPDQGGEILHLNDLPEYAAEHFPEKDLESGSPEAVTRDDKPVTVGEYVDLTNSARDEGFFSITPTLFAPAPQSFDLAYTDLEDVSVDTDRCDIVTINTAYQHDITKTAPVVNRNRFTVAFSIFSAASALSFTVKSGVRRRAVDGLIAPDEDVVDRVAKDEATAAEKLIVETYRIALQDEEDRLAQDLYGDGRAVRRMMTYIGTVSLLVGGVGAWMVGGMHDGLDYDPEDSKAYISGLDVGIPSSCSSEDTVVIHHHGLPVNDLEDKDGNPVIVNHDVDDVTFG